MAAGEIRKFIPFPGYHSKVNVIPQLEHELTYFETTVQHFFHYITRTLLEVLGIISGYSVLIL